MDSIFHKKNLIIFIFFLIIHSQNLSMAYLNTYLSPFAKVVTGRDNNPLQRKSVMTIKQQDGTTIRVYPNGIKEEVFKNGIIQTTVPLEGKKQSFNPHSGVLTYQDKKILLLTIYTKDFHRQRSMSDSSTPPQEIFHKMNTAFGIFKNQYGEEIHTIIYPNGDYTEESSKVHRLIQEEGSFIKTTTTNKETNEEVCHVVFKNKIKHMNPAYWAVLRYRLKAEGLYKKNMELTKVNNNHANNWL